MIHSYPIDDIDEPVITEAEVRNRVDDWLHRLDDLFKEIKHWAAANGWRVEERAPIPMHEEPMAQFALPAREQPAVYLHSPDGGVVWVNPIALWVIGANGRIDFDSSRKGAFTLIDVAEPERPPQWILHKVGRGKGEPFEPRLIGDMV